MIDFKFTKPNGVAPIGTIKKINPILANTYQKIGLGIIVQEEVKKTKKKTK